MANHQEGIIRAAAIILAVVSCVACARSARRGEPLAGNFVVTEAAQGRGRLVFMQNCC